jgi:methylated-DNA-protein-cysteine methyltransferase related protein
LRVGKKNNHYLVKTFERVYKIVSKIPKGKVMTYKQVAVLAKTTPRVVGFALHVNKDPLSIPCHRVIKSNGTLASGYAFGGKTEQERKLLEEGIIYQNFPGVLK